MQSDIHNQAPAMCQQNTLILPSINTCVYHGVQHQHRAMESYPRSVQSGVTSCGSDPAEASAVTAADRRLPGLLESSESEDHGG